MFKSVFMNKPMKFIREMLSSVSDTSSKRFNGTIGFIIYVLLTIFVVVADYLKDFILEDTSVILMKTLVITSAALL